MTRIILLLSIICVSIWLFVPAWLIEAFYSTSLYIGFMNIYANTIGLMPLALTEWLTILWFFGFVVLAVPFTQKFQITRYLASVFWRYIRYLGLTFVLLLTTWGFNHKRLPLEAHWPVSESFQLSNKPALLRFAIKETNRIANSSQYASNACEDYQVGLESMSKQLNKAQANLLQEKALPAIEGQGRYFAFSDFISSAGISGVFNPLSGQAAISKASAPPVQWVTLAHELAHLNGFAKEQDANFIAFETLRSSDQVHHNYLAWLGFWRRIKHNYWEQLDIAVIEDLNCINVIQRSIKPNSMKKVVKQANHRYLKAAGNKRGIESYQQGFQMWVQYIYQNDVLTLP